MSCINKDLVQKYIDGETSPAEASQIERHISGCEKCAAEIELQRKKASGIKNAINILTEGIVPLPNVELPREPEKKHFFKVRRIACIAAAACILVFVIILSPKKESENQAEIIVIEPGFAPEFDANRPVSEQEIVITIIDSEGNKTEYFE
jgi:hypothetical protein